MKLLQINIKKSLSKKEIKQIGELVPVNHQHNNGKFWIKKINKHFDSKKQLKELKLQLMQITKLSCDNINFTFQE